LGNVEDGIKVSEQYTYYGSPYDECLKGFRQRMQNLAPFISFVKRLGGIQRYPEYDMITLGFGTMLYILENMLIGKEECGMDDIAFFLQRIVDRVYKKPITMEEAKELAFHVRDAIMGSGEVYSYEYMNLETGEKETIDVRLTDVAFYEIKKSSRYKLTEQGMEMLFKTREIYSEFRINVTQLYLKQQIEKGVFIGALQTVNELNLQVRQLRERLSELVINIRQNVLGLQFSTVKEVFDKIKGQLEKEHREFGNIKYILEEQKRNLERVKFTQFTEKERQALNQIQVLSERLELVAGEHDRLFNEKLDIIAEYIKVIELRIRLGIADHIDFERDIMDPVIRNSPPIDKLQQVLAPLIVNVRKNRAFNFMKALSYQGVRSEEEEEKESVDVEKQLEEKEQELKKSATERNNKIKRYLESIFNTVYERGSATLEDILTTFSEEMYERACYDFDFYSIIVMLHQRAIVDFDAIYDMADKLIFDFSASNINLEYIICEMIKENNGSLKMDKLLITATKQVIKLKNDNVITNFTFTAGGQNG